MNFIGWLVVGSVIGWLASVLVKTSNRQASTLNIVVAPSAEVDPARTNVTHRKGMPMNNEDRLRHAHRDPLDDAPGGRRAGTGVRAVVGGLAGTPLAVAIPARNLDHANSRMSSNWAAIRAATSLSWGRARHVARDAWNRISPSS